MRSLREKVRTSAWPGRVALTFAALSLILTGVAALQEGRLHYANYWGGSVFAPLAIVLGFCVLVIVVVKWRPFNGAPPKLAGKDARRQQRAAARSPVQDFDKPWNP
jgi:hypothetical protein